MTESELIKDLRRNLEKRLPFAAYRMPGKQRGKAFLQKNSERYTTEEFTESGFVFAPFDSQNPTYLIPREVAEEVNWELSVPPAPEGGVRKAEKNSPKDGLAEGAHIELVERGLDQLRSGVLEKVVLSRKEELIISEPDPFLLFQDLLRQYPNAFVYLWYHPDTGCWLAATPEILLEVAGRQVSTMSLAGTQVFQEGLEVNWGNKEQQEQKFVTDEIVKNLEPHTSDLKVFPVKTVKAGKLLHLRTDITARFPSPEGGLKHLIQALHPTPAVCGLPKEKAKAFILKEEGYDREFYTGFLGELNLQKSRHRVQHKRNVEQLAYRSIKTETHLFVNLRCMKVDHDRVVLFIGGGITADSDPVEEWKETVEKAGTMKRVLFH